MPGIVAALALVVCASFAVFMWRFHKIGASFPELRADSHPTAPEAPRASVLVAMKDEEALAERCVRSILAQQYPDLELIVINDRSQDATADILDRLALEVGLTHVRVHEVPEGWGGQNHAFHCGAQAATGAFLVFTDADCRFESERTVAMAIAEARAEKVGLLTLIPRMEAPTGWEKIYLPVCSFLFLHALEIADVNDPDHPAGFAFGPFMVLERAAYDAMGGHERVRGVINGDVAFGRIAKQEGVPSRVLGNAGLLSTRMYGRPSAAWTGWTRNFYNSIQSAPRLFTSAAISALFLVTPTLAVIASAWLSAMDPSWWPALASWGAMWLFVQVALARMCRAMLLPAGWTLLQLPGAIFMTAVCAWAGLSALRGASTRWHGVTYAPPLRIPPR